MNISGISASAAEPIVAMAARHPQAACRAVFDAVHATDATPFDMCHCYPPKVDCEACGAESGKGRVVKALFQSPNDYLSFSLLLK